MTPFELDAIISGAKVYIYRRPQDGSLYASVHDFSRFNVRAENTVRVPLSPTTTVDDVLTHETVKAAINALS